MDYQEKDKVFNTAGLELLEPDYGTGMRKIRGIKDLSQKEAAALLGMTQQQLSQLEKKKQWSEEMQQRVSEKMNIPRSGLDYLANRNDLITFIVQNNTITDKSTMMNSINGHVSHNYNIGDTTKAEEIISKIEKLLSKLDKNTESLKKEILK